MHACKACQASGHHVANSPMRVGTFEGLCGREGVAGAGNAHELEALGQRQEAGALACMFVHACLFDHRKHASTRAAGAWAPPLPWPRHTGRGRAACFPRRLRSQTRAGPDRSLASRTGPHAGTLCAPRGGGACTAPACVRTHTPLVAHICAIAMIGLVTAPADVVAMDMLAARLTGTRAAARRRDAAPHNAARATSPTAATRVPVLVWMRLTRCIHHLRRPTAARLTLSLRPCSAASTTSAARLPRLTLSLRPCSCRCKEGWERVTSGCGASWRHSASTATCACPRPRRWARPCGRLWSSRPTPR